MKATGIVRKIDDLGRVVIPKEIRRTMRIREGDPSAYIRLQKTAKKRCAAGLSVAHLEDTVEQMYPILQKLRVRRDDVIRGANITAVDERTKQPGFERGWGGGSRWVLCTRLRSSSSILQPRQDTMALRVAYRGSTVCPFLLTPIGKLRTFPLSFTLSVSGQIYIWTYLSPCRTSAAFWSPHTCRTP